MKTSTYNKSLIMKDAWKLYKNKFQRRGRTFGECLAAAWRWEKDAVRARSEREARLQAEIARSWAEHEANKNNPCSNVSLTWDDCYNSNSRLYGAQYCGD